MNAEKDYTNGTVTVHWKSEICQHAAKCVSNLPKVFNTAKRPWINMDGAPTEDIVRVVEMCPSGALTYHYNDSTQK